jgi:parallel beta helix pectate lyase-like protein
MAKVYALRAAAFVLLSALFLLPGVGQAANVTAGCPGGSGGTYASISAALAAIGPTGPSTITVTGTCNENVTIVNSQSITIVAGTGGARVVAPKDNDVFDIFTSTNITLQGLELIGVPPTSLDTAGVGVFLTDSSLVHLVQCNVRDNEGGGVFAQVGSRVTLNHTQIRNNNPGDGLDVVDNSTADMVASAIVNNGQVGFGSAGIFVDNESSAVIRQTNFIQNNGDYGIFVRALSNARFQSGFVGRFTTLLGHAVDGIVVTRDSHLQVGGASPQVVTGNGSSCPSDPTCGGIFAFRGSVVTVGNGSVSGNQGSGVNADQGSNVSLGGLAMVSNNSGDGVHVAEIAFGNIAGGATISGNGGFSVFCDARSLVDGNLSGFANVSCNQSQTSLATRPSIADRERISREREQ